MISYPLLIQTLYEFGLISEDQALDSIADYEREEAEYEARKESYRQKWLEDYAALPFWRRPWMGKDGWIIAWLNEPFEVRHPS